MKTTTLTIRKKKGAEPVVACTAYDSVTARLASEAGVDLILVGDSLGNVVLGFDNTMPVTLEMMLHHTAAVTRAQPDALVVADVPFALAGYGPDRLLEACARLMQEAGAAAVKLEGGRDIADKVALLTRSGVPVLGHLGLLPQQVYQLGQYRMFGKTDSDRESLLADARALEDAGAFAIVGEMIQHDTAGILCNAMRTPLIGIGSGGHCDGQILVCNDLLGLTTGKVPSFVKQYANLAEQMKNAFAAYAKEVRERSFPS